MDNLTTIETLPEADAEYQTAIDQFLTEMEQMKGDMDKRQKRIEELRAETEAMLATLPTAPFVR